MKTILGLGLALAMAVVSTTASADARTDVRTAIMKKRSMDLAARGQRAPVALYLRGMGQQVVMPIVEVLSGGPLAAGLPAEALAASRRDLVEAIGLLRDARGTQIVASILDKETDLDMTRTAAEALARIGTDDAVMRLERALAASAGPRATAILSGMGECRRASIATILADRLAAHPEPATARVLAKALGSVGNAWAWQTMTSRAEEQAVRAIAARALVDAAVHYTGEARSAAGKALLIVDAPETAELLRAAKRNATPEVAAAVDALAVRLATNPSR